MSTGIHIGREIESRVNQLRLTKTEFGKRIGVPQQNINRIYEKGSIDTERLEVICKALDFNFFELYCSRTEIRQAGRDYVEGGKIEHKGTEYNGPVTIADEALRAENERLKEELLEARKEIIDLMKEKR